MGRVSVSLPLFCLLAFWIGPPCKHYRYIRCWTVSSLFLQSHAWADIAEQEKKFVFGFLMWKITRHKDLGWLMAVMCNFNLKSIDLVVQVYICISIVCSIYFIQLFFKVWVFHHASAELHGSIQQNLEIYHKYGVFSSGHPSSQCLLWSKDRLLDSDVIFYSLWTEVILITPLKLILT